MMASGRVRGMVALAALIAAGMLVLGAAGALAADRDFTMRVENKRIDIGSGLSYDAWTYGGTVPGPLLRATVGDKVTVHLVNDTEIAHGLDIHAAEVAPSKHFAPVAAKSGLNYTLRRQRAGRVHVSLQRGPDGDPYRKRHVRHDDRRSQGQMAGRA